MTNKIYLGDSEDILKTLPDECVDLVITSPPYDNLRSYNGIGNTWNHSKFKAIANELKRNYIGIEMSEEYYSLCIDRLKEKGGN